MRRRIAALGVVCALAGAVEPARAQDSGTTSMPGQVVGTPFSLNSPGTAVQKPLPSVGSPIGSPLSRPYDPSKPFDAFKGTNIDPKSIVAPLSGYPSVQTQQPDLLDKLYAKLSSVTGFFRPTSSTTPAPFTPGIFRRDRQRAKNRMWRWD